MPSSGVPIQPTQPNNPSNMQDDPVNMEDIRQEYNEEQERLQRSMRKVRYRTGVLLMVSAIFICYLAWYRPEARRIESKKTQETTLTNEVASLTKELKNASAVANYFAPIVAYTQTTQSTGSGEDTGNVGDDQDTTSTTSPLVSDTGIILDPATMPLELWCLDLINNSYLPSQMIDNAFDEGENADNTEMADTPQDPLRDCTSLLSGTQLSFDTLRATYLLQNSGTTQTYFDLQRTLAYIDTILLENQQAYDAAQDASSYYDRVTSIDFGDVTPAQNNTALEVVPVTITMRFDSELEAIDFARKIESRLIANTALHHLYMIDDMTFDIAQHDSPQDVTISLSLYLYNNSITG